MGKGIEYLILEMSMKSCVYIITLLIRDGQHDFEDYMLEVVAREREGVHILEQGRSVVSFLSTRLRAFTRT